MVFSRFSKNIRIFIDIDVMFYEDLPSKKTDRIFCCDRRKISRPNRKNNHGDNASDLLFELKRLFKLLFDGRSYLFELSIVSSYRVSTE